MKKFYAVIGNPPYQEDPELGSTRALPVYDKFMDESYKIGTRVELVTPARFLFDAGQTKKDWNQKMLNDDHLKVLYYEDDSSRVFPSVDIKGGVAVTYHDSTRKFDSIGTFIPIPELRVIVGKASPENESDSLAAIAESQNNYNFDTLYKDHPDYRQYISGEGRHSQLKSNSLIKVPIFSDAQISPSDLRIYGLVNGKRGSRWCSYKYINQDHVNLDKFKVFLAASNGSGAYGEVLSAPFIGKPNEGCTQTFMSIGAFNSVSEAENLLKYIKTRFCRSLLGALKKTQHNPPVTWAKIPLQDFTDQSDIDWSQSVSDIDRQLYRKYGLDNTEIEFIESHVKEMN